MLRLLGAVLLVSLVTGTPAYGQQRAQFLVQATVPARVTLATVEQPTRLWLTEDDVARGYKDVSARYRVASNDSRGWLLRLSPRLGVTAQVEVRGLAAPLVLGEHGVEVYQPRASEPRHLELDYRFVLEPGTQPGSYELPIHLSATPL